MNEESNRLKAYAPAGRHVKTHRQATQWRPIFPGGEVTGGVYLRNVAPERQVLKKLAAPLRPHRYRTPFAVIAEDRVNFAPSTMNGGASQSSRMLSINRFRSVAIRKSPFHRSVKLRYRLTIADLVKFSPARRCSASFALTSVRIDAWSSLIQTVR
jgi:hypothetical protein